MLRTNIAAPDSFFITANLLAPWRLVGRAAPNGLPAARGVPAWAAVGSPDPDLCTPMVWGVSGGARRRRAFVFLDRAVPVAAIVLQSTLARTASPASQAMVASPGTSVAHPPGAPGATPVRGQALASLQKSVVLASASYRAEVAAAETPSARAAGVSRAAPVWSLTVAPPAEPGAP
jgi:hypothetical protein